MNVAMQRASALELANVVRVEHGRLRRDLATFPQRDGRALAAALLRDPAPEVETMRVELLLKACQRTGESTLRRWFRTSGVSGSSRLGNIPPGKRETLAKLVEA